MNLLTTERLQIRHMNRRDAPFYLGLINEECWYRHIGDKGIRTVDAAADAITKSMEAMYERHGFGLNLVALRECGSPIGICGLIKRESLDDVDLGFALLNRYHKQGYAREAAQAVLEQGLAKFGLRRIVAITTDDNHASSELLQSIGMTFEKVVERLPDGRNMCLFALERVEDSQQHDAVSPFES